MRVIRFFLSFAFFLLVLSVAGFLIGREILLFKTIEDLRNSITKLKRAATGVDYLQQCSARGGRGEPIKQTQLRFLSDQEYVVEVLCQYFTDDPITVVTVKLPPFVKKVPGQAGLIWDPTGRSGVVVESLGLARTLVLDGEEIVVTRGIASVEGNFPIASCENFGYHCCDSVTEIGEQGQISQTSNCSQQCFEVCQPRPVALRFLSDPAADLRTREVTVQKNSDITFHYVTDPANYQLEQVIVDFGDGQTQTTTEPQGQVTHQYQNCQQAQCQYTASVQVMTSEGITSVITPIASLKVTVK